MRILYAMQASTIRVYAVSYTHLPEHFINLICSGAFSVPLKKSKEHKNMEFLTGAVQKEDLGIAEILARCV